jgi:hypothetical protein
MKSSWDTTKERSKYHFNNFKNDPEFDKVTKLGKIKADYSNDVAVAIKSAKPATWSTMNKDRLEELDSEEYDLQRAGYGKNHQITHVVWQLTPNMKRISELFALDNCTECIHVQMPGEVWNLHLDNLEKLNPTYPSSIVRIHIALTDWEQGHFCSYGNYLHNQWHAGEVTTVDWRNVPHSTANAGLHPRVTLELTGVITEKTTEFINRLKRFNEHELNEPSLAW